MENFLRKSRNPEKYFKSRGKLGLPKTKPGLHHYKLGPPSKYIRVSFEKKYDRFSPLGKKTIEKNLARENPENNRSVFLSMKNFFSLFSK